MTIYNTFIKRAAQAIGATQGDVCLFRLASDGYTKQEKKDFLILEIDCTEQELQALRDKAEPQATFLKNNIGLPGLSYDEWLVQQNALLKEAKKLPFYGMKIDFNDLGLVAANLDTILNTDDEVEPIQVDTSILKEKT